MLNSNTSCIKCVDGINTRILKFAYSVIFTVEKSIFEKGRVEVICEIE